MGDLVKFLLAASMIISFILASIAAFVLVLNLILSLLFITVADNVFSDIFAMVNIWMPFNLSVIWLWLSTAAFAFLAYRLALVAYTWAGRLVSKS